MKRFCLILIAALGGWSVPAQTNVTDALPAPRGPKLITSDSADFDLGRHQATYRGQVHVSDPQMNLTCERLVADVPQAGGHVNHIVAQTNVMIDFLDDQGHTHHATGDMAVYTYSEQGGTTNETVTLTGGAKVENEQGWLTGEPIVWDRQNNHLSALNQRMIYRQNFGGPAADTNPAAAGTNPPVRHPTNSPPATVENTDTPPR